MTLFQNFGPLFEGANGAYVPEVAYVQQKDKVFFAKGDIALTESVNGVTLVENFDDLELIERVTEEGKTVKAVKDGQWFVEGPYQRSGVKNANGRTYGRPIWDSNLAPKSRVMEKVAAKGMIGHLEHPKDGITDGTKGALVTTSLKLREDGVVWGKSELLDTPHGLILQEYTRKGVRWGVSSRGNGSVNADGQVNKDYTVETWDAVMNPSVPGAYPKPQLKSSTNESSKDTDNTVLNDEEETTTESAKAFLAEVRALGDVDILTLGESERRDRLKAVMSYFAQADSLRDASLLTLKQHSATQDWLVRKMRDSGESIILVTESTDTDDGTTRDTEAYLAREAALRQTVNELRESFGKADDISADLQSGLDDATAKVTTAVVENESLTAQLTESQGVVDRLRKQLELAQTLLVQETMEETSDDLAYAVNDAIERVPALASYRNLLEMASDEDGVDALAEALLPEAMRKRRNEQPSENTSGSITERRTLPPSTFVESDSSASRPSVHTNKSSGARAAGAALKAMGTCK